MNDHSRAATGYPAPAQNGYPAPGQQQYYYPNHNPYNATTAGGYYARATLLRRFFAGLISVFIILGVILLIVWLVLRPRIPSFTVESATLSSLNVSNSPSEISGTWSLRFSVTNPNKKLHVYYDEMEARLVYERALIAQNQLPPFDQPTRNQTSMEAQLVAANAYIPGAALDAFNRDRNRNGGGIVRFDVQLLALVRFKAGGWRARRRLLRVFCEDIPLHFPPNASNKATLSGAPKRCAVGI